MQNCIVLHKVYIYTRLTPNIRGFESTNLDKLSPGHDGNETDINTVIVKQSDISVNPSSQKYENNEYGLTRFHSQLPKPKVQIIKN